MKKQIMFFCVIFALGMFYLLFALALNSAPQNRYSQNWMSKVDPVLSSIHFTRSKPLTLTESLAKPGAFVQFASLASIADFLSVDLTNPDPDVRVLMKFDGELEKLNALGIKVQSRIGNILTAHFPISKLQSLAELSEVGSIELGMPINPTLDVSASKVRAPLARSAFGYKGQNVIIGIIDTGIDITHEDFKKSDGTTRILYIWDQLSTGSPPFGYTYGTEWNSTQINNGTCTERDNTGHGTHVAGIAAGNGRATGNNIPAGTYVGMAPEADIIFVRLDFRNFANIIDGLLWIGSKAASLGKPWVANLSLGTKFGPRDGTSLFEQAVFGVTNQTDLGKGRGKSQI